MCAIVEAPEERRGRLKGKISWEIGASPASYLIETSPDMSCVSNGKSLRNELGAKANQESLKHQDDNCDRGDGSR
jgi:hypothetical protein